MIVCLVLSLLVMGLGIAGTGAYIILKYIYDADRIALGIFLLIIGTLPMIPAATISLQGKL